MIELELTPQARRRFVAGALALALAGGYLLGARTVPEAAAPTDESVDLSNVLRTALNSGSGYRKAMSFGTLNSGTFTVNPSLCGEGELMAKGYERQIELESISFGATVEIDRSGGTSVGRPVVNDLSVSKIYDSASGEIDHCLRTMKPIPAVRILVRSESPTEAAGNDLRIFLTNVFLASTSVDGSESFQHSFAMDYGSISVGYSRPDPGTGAYGTPRWSCHNVVAGTTARGTQLNPLTC